MSRPEHSFLTSINETVTLSRRSVEPLVAFAITLFMVMYITKQTYLGAEYAKLVEITLIVLQGIIMMATWRSVLSYLSTVKFTSLHAAFFASFLLSLVFFQTIEQMLSTIWKAGLLLWFAILTKVYGRALYIALADITLVILLIFVWATEVHLIQNEYVSYPNWSKNYAGFVNPNLLPLFTFSVLSIYFVCYDFKRFGLAVILMLLGWIWIDIFSRAALLGSGFFLVYVMLSFINHKLTVKLTSGLACVVIFGSYFFILVITMAFFIDFRISAYLPSVINDISSNRFGMLDGLNISNYGEYSIIEVKPFDSIFYEMIFVFGPFLVMAYLTMLGFIFKPEQKKNQCELVIYTVCVFTVVGFFEGMLMKFTCLSIFITLCLLEFIRSVTTEIERTTKQGLSKSG